MRLRSMLVGFAALAVIGSCATPATYGPASGDGTGYSEVALEDNRYRVTYRGGSTQQASDYALLRASEVTLARGDDWFQVVDSYVEQERSSSPRTSVGIGGSTGSYGSGVGVGIGIGFPLGGGKPDAVQTYEILMGSGQKPEDVNAYDARSISSSLRPAR